MSWHGFSTFRSQNSFDVCRDLHCVRDHFTWCQFHQHSTYSFYARRSRMLKKRQSSQHCHFTLLGSGSVKVACRMLTKLTPGHLYRLLYVLVCVHSHFIRFQTSYFKSAKVVIMIRDLLSTNFNPSQKSFFQIEIPAYSQISSTYASINT